MIDIGEDRQRAFTVAELVELFNVHEDTVLRWARDGLLGAFRTPSPEGLGHWRFLAHKVREQMRGQDPNARHNQAEPPPSPVVDPAPPRGDRDGTSGCPAFDVGDCECAVPCVR